MATSSSAFAAGRARNLSYEHEDRNNNIEYNKAAVHKSSINAVGVYNYRSENDFRSNAPSDEYRVNSDYRTNASTGEFDRNNNNDDYRAEFRNDEVDYRSSSFRDQSHDYKSDFRGGSGGGGSSDLPPARSNSGEYSPGGSRIPVGGSENTTGYPPSVWNYLGGIVGRRVSSFPYGGGNESGMYSQQSNISYMDAPHGANQSQAQMYQGYQSHGSHPASMGVGVSPQAIGVAHQAQYLQPGQAAHQRVPISHTTRASPITVQWLLENYETADGVSLPRSTLYHHYLRHCAENKIDAVNAASFGKLIRSVFLGLKTRRLGTRGNSKYHYYGIRVKPNSPLARLTDDTQVALRAQPSQSTKRSVSTGNYDDERKSEQTGGQDDSNSSHATHQQYLGDVSEGLPEVPVIELDDNLPEEISKQDITNFGNYYRSHCEALLEVISTLQFEVVEALWQSFYVSPAAANKNDNGTFETSDYNISKNTLIILCKYVPVQQFIKETDYVLYQKLVNVLVPDVLRAVPSSLTQSIRNFAKGLENLLIGSMSEMPKEIVNIKVAAVGAFSQTLRRYTSLNHLAQAARAVLQNPQQINQMWADLNKVDFNNVQEQSSWVCQCDETLIQKLETDFKQTLAQQQTLEQWAQWLETVVGVVLEQHQGRDSYPKAARQFLLNWSFYSSMIIRDLTLRSAASFGSFHLIRLLYDEYMFYLIEHKVATHTGKSPMSVMAECVGLSSLSQGSYNGNLANEDEDEDSSNDEAPATESALQTRLGNQPAPLMSQAAVNYDEPLAKRMKQEYTS